MGGKRMILFPFVLIIFSISSPSAQALGEPSRFKTVILPNGTETECAVYTKTNQCPPGHEITEECDHKYGLMKCSQCKENLYQCDFTTTEYLVKCEPPLCPENGKETKVKVTYFDNKTCQVSCVCNEANGYTGKSGLECNKHPHICGRDKELKNGTCVACSPGFHNPSTDYGPCVSFEPTTPSTSSGSPDQGFWHDNKTWILAIIFISVFLLLVLMAVFAWYCCCRGQANPCNIACCNSTAIQNSQTRTQAQESPGDPPPYTLHSTHLLDGDLSDGVNGHQPNGIPGARPNGIPGASPNGIPGASPNGIPGASSNGIPGASPNGIPGASSNGIPSASSNGIPGASSNGIPGASPNGIPGASSIGIPCASSNGIPGASLNGIPGARPNGIPGARPNGIPGARPNGIPSASSSAHEDAENGPNGSTGRSISGRRTPTGTADSSIRSLEGQPDPLDSGGDSNDHFLGWDPLTSEATSLNLPRQGVQDPEETGRKVPIPAQDIGTGSDDENDEVDDDNEGAQALLDGPAYGLVELDKDRDMSHVPMVQ